jgi:hypothetical protein
VRRTRVEAGAGVVVVVALVALAGSSFQRQEEPSAQVRAPSTTPAPSTTADRRGFRPLAGVPLAGPTRLRLLVASEPRPFVVDLDQDSVQPVTGLPTDGERVVSVLPVGEHAVIVSDRVCTSCRPSGPEVYGIWRHSTTAVRLGSAQEVVAARDGRAVWLLGHQNTTSCTLGKVGLDGRPRRPARPVSCATTLLGELPAGLLVASGTSDDPWERPTSLVDHRGRRTRLGFPAADLLVAATGQLVLTSAEPLAPLTLTNLRSGASWRLGWPSRLRGGTHAASIHPNGRDIVVGFHGLASRAEAGYDLWLLDTVTRRWQHLPDLPAADIAAKDIDLAWTRDGRLVVLTGTATLGQVVAVWRPGQRRLAIRPVKLPEPSPGTDTLAIW